VLSTEGTGWFAPEKLTEVIDTYENSQLYLPGKYSKFRAQAQRSLEGVCFTLRMWVIHKIRLHTHVGRLVVPVRPMSHHLGVGFVVRLDMEPFNVRRVHRSAHPKKNAVLVENQRLVSTMSKLNQSGVTVS